MERLELHTFAQCPTFISQKDANFVFFGISDHETAGVTNPETAYMIRESSLECSNSAMWRSLKPPGWYCLNRKKQLLSGAWCYDAGDLIVGVDTENKLGDLLKQVAQSGAKPVILGGDHRVTGWVTKQITGPMQILHLDAHRDTGPVNDGLNPKNVVSYLLTLPQIKRVVTAGVRGVVDLGLQYTNSRFT